MTCIFFRTEPKNVKLIYIKCEDDDQKETLGTEINVLEGDKFSPASKLLV